MLNNCTTCTRVPFCALAGAFTKKECWEHTTESASVLKQKEQEAHIRMMNETWDTLTEDGYHNDRLSECW